MLTRIELLLREINRMLSEVPMDEKVLTTDSSLADVQDQYQRVFTAWTRKQIEKGTVRDRPAVLTAPVRMTAQIPPVTHTDTRKAIVNPSIPDTATPATAVKPAAIQAATTVQKQPEQKS